MRGTEIKDIRKTLNLSQTAFGQSMAKVIAHGDAIGLVRLDNWREFFPFGEIYAIVTSDNQRLIKVITKGETNDIELPEDYSAFLKL